MRARRPIPNHLNVTSVARAFRPSQTCNAIATFTLRRRSSSVRIVPRYATAAFVQIKQLFQKFYDSGNLKRHIEGVHNAKDESKESDEIGDGECVCVQL